MIADDVYILGPPVAAAAAFREYRSGIEGAGGAVNLAKSVAWSPERTVELVAEIAKVTDYGNPVSIQTTYLQLRYCAEPKIAHLLRCARPDLIQQAAQLHDNAIMDGLSGLLGATEDLLRRQDPQQRDTAAGWAHIMQDRGHAPPLQYCTGTVLVRYCTVVLNSHWLLILRILNIPEFSVTDE